MTGRVVVSDRGVFFDGNFVLRVVQAGALALSDPDGELGVEYTHPCHCQFGCSWCKPDAETGERVGTTEVFIQEADLGVLHAWVSRQQTKPTADHTQAIADKLAPAFAFRRRQLGSAATQRSPRVAA